MSEIRQRSSAVQEHPRIDFQVGIVVFKVNRLAPGVRRREKESTGKLTVQTNLQAIIVRMCADSAGGAREPAESLVQGLPRGAGSRYQASIEVDSGKNIDPVVA